MTQAEISEWLETSLSMLDKRNKTISNFVVIAELEPDYFEESLRRISSAFNLIGVVSNFAFIKLREPADIYSLSRVAGVRYISYQKRHYPMAVGIDELMKRVGIATDPLLKQLKQYELERLGFVFHSLESIPVMETLSDAISIVSNPISIIKHVSVRFPFRPPVIARDDWRLVTYTKEIIDAPEDNKVRIKVAVIDSGTRYGPGIGYPPKIENIPLTVQPEPPVDMLGHGSWVNSCAFGRPAWTPYGYFYPVAQAEECEHYKIFAAVSTASSLQVMKAMELAVKAYSAKVVNMSLGGVLTEPVDKDPEAKLLSQLTRQYGTIFCVAAGNDNGHFTISTPAASPDALAVAAVDYRTKEVASYSSRGYQGKYYEDKQDIFDDHYGIYGENLLKPDVAAPGGDKGAQIVAASSLWYDGIFDFFPNLWEMSMGTCLPGDTTIYTPDGPVELGELEEGDTIYSFDGEKIVPVVLRAILDQGIKEVYEVELNNGRTLIATGNHPVLVYNKGDNRYKKRVYYKRVDMLNENDTVILAWDIPENIVPELSEAISNDVAVSLGRFLADGWVVRSKRNNMICIAEDGDLSGLGIEMKPYERGRWNYTYSKRLALALLILGLGQKHNQAKLPKWLYHLPKDKMVSFLLGFAYGDGHRFKDETMESYRIELASEWLIRDLKTLCDYAGIFSGKIGHRKRINKPPNSKKERLWETWGLSIRFDRKQSKMSRVKRVRRSGKEKVYDLTVPPYSNFIANGIIVHNSMATPHIAGAAAILLDRGKIRNTQDIKNAMKPLVQGKQKTAWLGYGLFSFKYF